MITEIERAVDVYKRVNEINDQIKAFKDMQNYAVEHGDEIGKKIWADKVKELRAERHQLHQSCVYMKFQTFCLVSKSYLTKSDYVEIWRTVDDIIERGNLQLLQDKQAT